MKRVLWLSLLISVGVAGWLVHRSLAIVFASPRTYGVPVQGVLSRDLRSTFGADRDGGRRKHRGVDIFAPRGTPVVASTAGVVLKVGEDRLGGRVVTVLGEGLSLYYYAHLDDWAPALRFGQKVGQGDLLGGVGTTGNARGTPPHLHFGIYRIGLGGFAVDPVPLLQHMGRRTHPDASPEQR